MTSQFPDDAAIAHVALGMMDRSLPKSEWTHAAHFAATLWLLRHRPDLDLAAALAPMIRAYNEATGGVNTDAGGYHETITLASLGAARRFAGAFAPDHPLHGVLRALLASPLGRSDWILAYWSGERLFSVAARRSWVDPDLRSWDFGASLVGFDPPRA